MKSLVTAFRSCVSGQGFGLNCNSVAPCFGINRLSLAPSKRYFSDHLSTKTESPTRASLIEHALTPAELHDWLNLAEPPIDASDIAKQIYFAYEALAGGKPYILPGLRILQISGAPHLPKSEVSIYGAGQFVEKMQSVSYKVIKSDFWESALGKELITALLTKKPIDPVFEKRSRTDMELTQTSFRECYQGTDRILKPFINYLNTCMNNWDKNKVYAPFIAVVNSSMVGKSRMFDELSKAGIFTFSVCLRPQRSAGFPPRTPLLADWFSHSKSSGSDLTREMEIFHIEFLKAFKNWIEKEENNELTNLTALWKARQLKPDLYSELLNRVSIASSIKSDSAQTLSRISELALIQKDLLSILASKTGIASTGKKVRFLFVYDEAINLVRGSEKVDSYSRFYYLRKSFQIFPMNDQASIFAVVTDTNSSIGNFSPSRYLDPSERARSLPESLFPPYWCVGSHDIWLECNIPFAMQDLVRPFYFSRYGRPYFHAIMKAAVASGEEMEGFSFLLDLLSRKLIGTENVSEFCRDIVNPEHRAAALAVLGTRLVLNVSAESRMASLLTSTHMRTCVAISEDRESVYTMSRAEPMLALSALNLTQQIGWKKLLVQLSESMGSLQVLPGSRGEVGAQILLLMAFEKLLLKPEQQLKSFDMVPLSEFVNLLTGDEVSESHKKALEGKYVRFVQFVQVFYSKPSADRLARMFTRGAALALKDGTPGTDLIIPVFCPPKDRDPYSVLVDPEWMSPCLIQVKSKEHPDFNKKRLSKTTSMNQLRKDRVAQDFNNNHKYLSIYLDAGEPSGREYRKRTVTTCESKDDDKQIAIAVHYLRPSHIYGLDDIDEVFAGLVRGSFEPTSIKGLSKETIRALEQDMRDHYEDEDDHERRLRNKSSK